MKKKLIRGITVVTNTDDLPGINFEQRKAVDGQEEKRVYVEALLSNNSLKSQPNLSKGNCYERDTGR